MRTPPKKINIASRKRHGIMDRFQLTLLASMLLALFFVSYPADAGIKKTLIVTGAASADGTCGTNNDGTVIALVDASSISDCDSTGGGTTTAWCGCDSATRVPLTTTNSATQTYTATTSVLYTTPIFGASGVYERKVTNVTVADDGAGTKPTGAIPITTDYATCTCNDATGCTMSIAEPTVTSGYGRELTVVSIGSGNCEIADSSGVVELGTTLVIEPTSTARFAYANSAWYNTSYKDNVP